MPDVDLFQRALGPEGPLEVKGVEFGSEGRRLDVRIDFARAAKVRSPECGREGARCITRSAYVTASELLRLSRYRCGQCYASLRACSSCGRWSVMGPQVSSTSASAALAEWNPSAWRVIRRTWLSSASVRPWLMPRPIAARIRVAMLAMVLPRRMNGSSRRRQQTGRLQPNGECRRNRVSVAERTSHAHENSEQNQSRRRSCCWGGAKRPWNRRAARGVARVAGRSRNG